MFAAIKDLKFNQLCFAYTFWIIPDLFLILHDINILFVYFQFLCSYRQMNYRVAAVLKNLS